MPRPFPFPIVGKHFIGLEMETLMQQGYDPARRIVPAWFGFRTQIERIPARCEIEVTGRSQFKLFVNGESVLFGPCRSVREIAYVDTLDIAPWLRAGENRIVMQVFSYPEKSGAESGPN